MNVFKKYMKNFTYKFSAVMAAIFLLASIAGLFTGKTLFNSDFHRQLFVKNNIYYHTHNAISSSMEGFISILKNNSPQDYQQSKEIFDLLEKSTTEDMVNRNLDTIRDGIFSFISGQKSFLPDLTLSSTNGVEKTDASTQNSNFGGFSAQALTRIDKVNLGAILQSFGRSDIIDYLSILKLINYLVTTLPGFLLLILTVLCLVTLSLSTRFIDIAKWLIIFFIVVGIFSLGISASLAFYTYVVIPQNISHIAMSIPLPENVILSYIQDCLLTLIAFFTLIGSLGLSLATGIYFLQKRLPSLILRQSLAPSTNGRPSIFKIKMQSFVLENEKIPKRKTNSIILNLLLILSMMTVLTAIGYRYSALHQDFEKNDFDTVWLKMKGTASVKEVIAARDAAIYDIEVRVVDEKSNNPIPNLQVYVYGKSGIQDFNETKLTDSMGSSKFSLDKGSFRIYFSPSTFLSQYVMPTPFFLDLKAAGSKIVTISLESIQSKQKWGIIEIEVLDKENKPIQGVELGILQNVSAPGSPDLLYSYTNTEGIAVFKVNEGNYKAAFTEAKLPKKYQLPQSIDVISSLNKVSRYTLRLVNSPAQKSPTGTPSPKQ